MTTIQNPLCTPVRNASFDPGNLYVSNETTDTCLVSLCVNLHPCLPEHGAAPGPPSGQAHLLVHINHRTGHVHTQARDNLTSDAWHKDATLQLSAADAALESVASVCAARVLDCCLVDAKGQPIKPAALRDTSAQHAGSHKLLVYVALALLLGLLVWSFT